MFSPKRASSIYAITACLLASFLFSPSTAVRAEDSPPDFKTLNKQLHKAYDNYQYEKALELAEKMHELKPDDVSTLYNLACINCLLAKKDKAYDWLEKAIEAGFDDVDYLKTDDDFKTIRAEDRFRAIVKSLRTKTEPIAAKEEANAQPQEKEKKAKQKKCDPGAEPDMAALQKVETLTGQLLAHSAAKEYKKALECALKAHEVLDNGLTNYNVACMYALNGKKDNALKYLDRAAGMGFSDIGQNLVTQMKRDSDLDSLRDDPRYEKALKKAEKTEKAAAKKQAKAQDKDTKKKEKKTKKDKTKAKSEEAKQKKRDPGARPDNATLQKVNQLTNQLLQHSDAKEYKKALECAIKAHEILDNSLTNYNVACMYALNGEKDNALKYLDIAAGMGFSDIGQNLVTQMKGDSDLDTLRDDPRYEKALKKAQKTEKAAAKRQAKARDKDKKKQEKKAKKDKPKKEKAEKKQAKAPARLDSQTVAKVNELTGEAIRLSQAKKYEEALEATLAARKLWDSGTCNYNVACVLSLLGRADEAFEALDKAVELGFNNPRQNMADKMREDSDLDSIRDDPRFEKMLKKADRQSKGESSAQPTRRRRPKTQAPPRHVVALSVEDQAKVTQLTQRLIAEAQSNNLDAALGYALEADAIADSGLTNYNVACMLSLLERKEEAFEYLFKAAEKGFDNFHQDLHRQMKYDSDLKFLRSDPRFAEALRLAKTSLRRPEEPEPVGRPVETRWKVTLPANHDDDKPTPLLVVLHNYAGNMDDHTRIWKKAAKETGVILLTPQGTWQLDDDGEQFQWGTDVEAVEEKLMEAIDAVMDDHSIDHEKIILAGFSQGGALTWELGIRNPDTFCGMIPVGGFIEEVAPADYDKEDIAQMRVFIMVGAKEPAHIIEANKQAAKELKKLGAEAKIRVYEDTGHTYPKNATQEQVKAVKYILNG